ncbi:hypothetical protein KBTX_01882 [wastewater metagenome]|uniref:DUF2306 domain-containing protein n=2 Tax=unclassified sequences TaxID=12908 RepID=A0A5B8R8U3_9ZZZZ|nr:MULTISPECIES: DUF2306 domain-containing protein [Arhodomonas]MCS4504332.1 DUF2306 domain-containing protein [Arhodomonas aquaeolei]QEA05559.1 hypothetical protein KBTEX_01882 [uncultured organism]
MHLQPLLHASVVIQVHVAAAVLALALGIIQFGLRRGGTLHRRVGRSWVALMALTAVSSLFIHELRVWGDWSPIHVLSLVTLATLVHAVRAVRAGHVRAHRAGMISLFVFALIGAGAFTLVPGRLLHTVFIAG